MTIIMYCQIIILCRDICCKLLKVHRRRKHSLIAQSQIQSLLAGLLKLSHLSQPCLVMYKAEERTDALQRKGMQSHQALGLGFQAMSSNSSELQRQVVSLCCVKTGPGVQNYLCFVAAISSRCTHRGWAFTGYHRQQADLVWLNPTLLRSFFQIVTIYCLILEDTTITER